MNQQVNLEQRVEELPGEERGIPSVNDLQSSTTNRRLVGMILLVIFCATGVIIYGTYRKNMNQANQEVAQKNLQLTNAVPARTFLDLSHLPKSTPVAPHALKPIPFVPPPLPSVSTAPPLPGSVGITKNSKSKPPQILDKSESSLMAVAMGAKPNTVRENSRPSEPLSQNEGMAELLTSTQTPMRQAELLSNRNFILAKGSFVDCALQTRLDSTIPGMTACVITRNIYSDNGKVLLIERGSTVSGEYKSNMRQGMARIFILWTRIKTPNGVIINLESPGADQLGGAGVPGYIDNHFWQRFGGALMLSLVDDVVGGISSKTGSDNKSQINFNGATDTTQDMATEALKNTIDIPPTLYKNQGEQVGIYIARDLDFSSVYDVIIP
ncbi:MAG: type IV secretion system protein VirB10 [Janthinobacterium lividum]